MGLDITVVAADWEHLARIPAADRLQAVTDTVHPDDCCDACEDARPAPPRGWIRPRQASWCAEYDFHGTTGTYGYHVRLANAWEDVRDSAAPDLRAALDRFLGGLVWDGPDFTADTEDDDRPPPARGFPHDPEPWRPHLLLLRAPDELPALARAWELAEPRLDELREPYAATGRADRPGRPDGFDTATALLREWGEIVTRTEQYGWGLIGLPY
ncbi:hypothetical protein ACWGB8_24050 [Kitasatospora sp. NPDC054939]